MLKADMHIHSDISDGSDSINQIIKIAELKGLDYIAITDHDTVSHFSKIPKDTKIKVIAGIEISAVDYNGGKVHILGYNLSNPEVVAELTQPMLEARNRNSIKQALMLIKNGFIIDFDRLHKADGKYLYKQHIMDYLVSTGQVPDMFGAFYNKTFKNNGLCAFDIEYAFVLDAIRAIKSAGGYAVLAHSGQQQNFNLIPLLASYGLDGVELNHYTHTENDRLIIKKYAAKYGLFLTGGSYYHGSYEPQPFGIGDFISEESGVNAICRI
jgi:phosphoribosyl 1,2-cyclic phosphate 1,2-diphosphodiesterase